MRLTVYPPTSTESIDYRVLIAAVCKCINYYTQDAGIDKNPQQVTNVPNTKTTGLGGANLYSGALRANTTEIIGNFTLLQMQSFYSRNECRIMVCELDVLEATQTTSDLISDVTTSSHTICEVFNSEGVLVESHEYNKED